MLLHIDPILYEDEELIFIDKPSGLVSQATRDPDRLHVVELIQRIVQRREGRRLSELALVHRLDKETSGVLCLARSKRASASLAEAFRRREIKKTYRALTAPWSAPIPETFTNHLAAPRRRGKGAARTLSVRSGGKRAVTRFKLLACTPHAAHLVASPLTGRRHQIRAHLCELNAPILGDELYGGPMHVQALKGGPIAIPRLMLHASRLELKHPLSKAPLMIEAPLPQDFTALCGALNLPWID